MPPKSVKGGRINGGDGNSGGDADSVSRVIRVIQELKSPKLASINSLLRNVVQSASSVVKGTDSQRRFNAQFSEFCRSALVGIADVEDAVYELEKTEGLVDNKTGTRSVNRIGVTIFIKAIVAFVASQTNALGEQYLEHVAMSAVSTASKMQQRPAETKRGAKHGRANDTRQGAADRRSLSRRRTDTSPTLGTGNDQDLPLLLSPGLSSLPPPSLLPKSGRGRGGLGSHHGPIKLSGMPAISVWLQPWLLPVTNAHGVALDRVMTDRSKFPIATEESVKTPGTVSVLDICTAPTASEMLRLWEARECALSSGVDESNVFIHTFTSTGPFPPTENEPPMFFPNSTLKMRASVPRHVLMDLVHYGICTLEVPFKDVV